MCGVMCGVCFEIGSGYVIISSFWLPRIVDLGCFEHGSAFCEGFFGAVVGALGGDAWPKFPCELSSPLVDTDIGLVAHPESIPVDVIEPCTEVS